MMPNGIFGYGAYPSYNLYGLSRMNGISADNAADTMRMGNIAPGGSVGAKAAAGGAAISNGVVQGADNNSGNKVNGKSSPAECQTCKERKYQDGSNENVSFKSPTHVSPNAAGAAVRAHEGEHVANAYDKAAQKNGKVVSASVSIHTAVCPECGRTYVSGGTTNTMIKYSNESNPYQQNQKALDAMRLTGSSIDYAA